MVNQVFCYCLAHAAKLYNIRVHAYCVMSNHYHLVVTDPDGNLPAFMSWFNQFVAKVLNTVWGRWEFFWAPNTYSAVRLETAEDILDKIIYTLTNPVKAFLVTDAGKWPGASSIKLPFGGTKSYKRPNVFFRENGPLPDQASLRLELPESVTRSPSEFKTDINIRIKQTQEERKEVAKRRKRPFLGLSGVASAKHTDRPTSGTPRRNLNPHVASKNGCALRNAMLRIKLFRAEYADARERFNRGEFGVIFPFGTYGLKKTVSIQSIPPPDIIWL